MTALAVSEVFQTKLTEELLVELCRVHKEGKDFRNVTALRCRVSPERLKLWLNMGVRHIAEETPTLHARLAMEFAIIEADLRAENIREVLDTTVKTEDIEFNDKGAPISKKLVQRSVHGTIWYMERRWRQYRKDHSAGDADGELSQLLSGAAPSGGLSVDQAMQICRQLAERMHVEPSMRPVLELFLGTGWKAPELPA